MSTAMSLPNVVKTFGPTRALDGLDRRQQAIASNLANLETPGYQAREVSFEGDHLLRLRGGDGPGEAEISDFDLAFRIEEEIGGFNVAV